jgi:hypothetical protein
VILNGPSQQVAPPNKIALVLDIGVSVCPNRFCGESPFIGRFSIIPLKKFSF